jgi:hypothetical protein
LVILQLCFSDKAAMFRDFAYLFGDKAALHSRFTALLTDEPALFNPLCLSVSLPNNPVKSSNSATK